MTRQTKTREQRANDDLLVATRVAERAAKKRDRLRAEYDQAAVDSEEADALREHAASNPFLPKPSPAPAARRPRAPRAPATPPPVDRVVDGVVVERAATG